MPPSRVALFWALTHPRVPRPQKSSQRRDAARGNACGRSRVDIEPRATASPDVIAMLNLVLALLAGVVTIAAPCTLPMLPILLGASVGPDRQGAAGDDRARLCACRSRWSHCCWARSRRVFDFDPNVLRERRRNPAARLRPVDDLAGAVRMAVDPAQWLARSSAARGACSRRACSAASCSAPRSAWSGRPAPGRCWARS